MTRIIKVEDMVAKNLPKVAPMLTTFYREDKVIAILRQAESVAEQLIKDRERIETEFIIQMEADRAHALQEIAIIKEQTRQEAIVSAKKEVFRDFSRMLGLIEAVKNDLVEQKKTWISEAEQDIVKLVLVIAEKLVLQELITHPDMLVTFIKAVLKETSEHQRVTIQVNPSDLALIEQHLPELKQTLGSVKIFEAESNSSIPSGGVVFDMDSGVLDAQVATQLHKLYLDLIHEPT